MDVLQPLELISLILWEFEADCGIKNYRKGIHLFDNCLEQDGSHA